MANTLNRMQNKRFVRIRLWMYMLLIFIFMLGFFERFAPGAFASDLMVEFKITGATLGSVTAIYFVTYTALQIPAGILADRVGPKKIVSTGAIIAGLGSLVFSLSPTLILITFGRFLVGLGGATVFIGIMKFNTQWFDKKNYGMISGVTLLLGNLGAAISAGPLAVLLSYATWRNTFHTTGITAILLGVLIFLFVENNPKDAGFHRNLDDLEPAERKKEKWYKELLQVFLYKDIWPVFIAGIGTNATFYAFAGLWGIPLLTDSFDLSNTQASLYTTLGLTAYGIFSLVIGWWSDKAGTRKPFVIGSSLISVLGWLGLIILPWQPGWSGILLYLMIGLAAAQMVVSFAVVKEVVPPWVAGVALALVNTGVFLAVSFIQPLFGLMIDLSWSGALINGAREYSFANYKSGLWLTFAVSFTGLIASLFVTETYCGKKEFRHIPIRHKTKTPT